MKMGRWLIMVWGVLGVGAMSAHAKADQMLLRCDTTNGKTLYVSNNNEKIRHALYDHANKAQMDFIVPHRTAKYRLWQGWGRGMTHSLILPHDGRKYIVFTSVDKKHSDTGVWIVKGDKLLATLRCDSHKIHINELDELSGITSISKN